MDTEPLITLSLTLSAPRRDAPAAPVLGGTGHGLLPLPDPSHALRWSLDTLVSSLQLKMNTRSACIPVCSPSQEGSAPCALFLAPSLVSPGTSCVLVRQPTPVFWQGHRLHLALVRPQEAGPALEALTVHLQGPMLPALALLSLPQPHGQQQAVAAFVRPSGLLHLLPLSSASDGAPSFQVPSLRHCGHNTAAF